MASDTFYTAVDIGTSKVATIIAKIGASGDLKIVGLGVVPSQGIYQGRVENPDEARETVRESLEEARRYLGRHRAPCTYVSISGDHITCLNTEGHLHASKDNGLMTPRSLHHLIQSSYPNVSNGTEVLHIIPIEYEVDGLAGVRNPVGLHADHVRVESHVVLAETHMVRNLVNLMRGCNLSVRSLVAQSLAAGEAVLTQDERELGVVLADMGAGTIDMTIFRSGHPWYSSVIPLGGIHMTLDLSETLDVPFYQAEALKVKWGNALQNGASGDREVTIPGSQEKSSRMVSRQALCQPLRDHLKEMMRQVLLRISQAGLRQLPPAGLVATGGCAEMPGFPEMAKSMLGCSVRVASPMNVLGLPSALMGPTYAATVGTLLWGIKHQGRERPYTNGFHIPWGYKRLLRRWSRDDHMAEMAVSIR